MGIERRRSERIPLNINATFILTGKIYEGRLFNVSINGIGASITSVNEIQTEFVPLRLFDLSFQTPSGEQIDLRVELAWFSRAGEEESTLKVGLKILDPPSAFKAFFKPLHAERLNKMPKEELISELLGAHQKIVELEASVCDQNQTGVSCLNNEDIYRILVETANNSMYILDRNYQYLFMNQKHILRLGLVTDNYYGHSYSAFHSPEETEFFTSKVNEVFTTGKPISYEYRSSRDQKDYLLNITPVKGPEDNISSVTVISEDITDRRLAEELLLISNLELGKKVHERTAELLALNESLNVEITERIQTEIALEKASEDWRTTFDSTKDVMLMLDIDFRIIKVNKATSLFFEKPYDEIIGHRFYALCADFDMPQEIYPLELLKRSKRHEESEIYLKGKDMWVLASADPIVNDRGEVTGAVHIIKDITEQKSLQLQLLHAQKMEAVGTLAGGIAHDFNNMLNVIMGYGSMVQDSLEADSSLKDQMNEVLAAADRAAILTRRLLLFSRKATAEYKPMDVNEMVMSMEKMLSRIIGEDIRLATDLIGTKAVVMADAGQIEQVLMNLATNARDAMPKGGSLTIKTELSEMDTEFIKAHQYCVPGAYAVISVTDTGTGIEKGQQNRIFDPFFTTKSVGKGTGLGLSIAYGIVVQHNGYIMVYSEPGEGTTFKIWLPVIEDTAEIKPGVEALTSIRGGMETILVAEDDASMRKLTSTVLEAWGYSVITSEDGEDAVIKFMENRDKIQLVILDMIMPKKNGKEAYEDIRKASPDIKTLFVTGYTMNVINTRELTESGFDFIYKPVLPKDLLNKVREVLDRI